MTPLQRRMARLALLVSAFALAAAGFGLVPRGFVVTHDVSVGRWAGGAPVAAWAVAQMLAALRARATPKRRVGWAWFAASFLLTVASTVYWMIDQFTLVSEDARWPAHAMAACIGTTLVLTTLALPLILIASDNEEPAIPPARIHDSSG
jgi:hypothetical protein